MQTILDLFPAALADALRQEIRGLHELPEEIRIRRGQAVCLRYPNREYYSDMIITPKDIRHIVFNAANGSFHSAVASMQNGYLPLPNGCRMGICGEAAAEEDGIRSVQNISSLCIRLANPSWGCSDTIYSKIAVPSFRNTILIGPPGAGKTTLLRDIIRRLSYEGHYISVADERGELSGMYRGNSAFDLGPRCDITYGMPKQRAAMMMLRSMSPQILAMDEITAAKDLSTITEAMGCGVALLTTVHGESIHSLKKPVFRPILDTEAFSRAVIISMNEGRRYYTVEELSC